MDYKVLCEVSFPAAGVILDINIPINRTIEYVCEMLNTIIKENISSTYKEKEESILVNKRTGEIYDKNVIVKTTNIGNGTKLTFY